MVVESCTEHSVQVGSIAPSGAILEAEVVVIMTGSSSHRFLDDDTNSSHFVEYLFTDIAHDVSDDLGQKLLQVFGLSLILKV